MNVNERIVKQLLPSILFNGESFKVKYVSDPWKDFWITPNVVIYQYTFHMIETIPSRVDTDNHCVYVSPYYKGQLHMEKLYPPRPKTTPPCIKINEFVLEMTSSHRASIYFTSLNGERKLPGNEPFFRCDKLNTNMSQKRKKSNKPKQNERYSDSDSDSDSEVEEEEEETCWQISGALDDMKTCFTMTRSEDFLSFGLQSVLFGDSMKIQFTHKREIIQTSHYVPTRSSRRQKQIQLEEIEYDIMNISILKKAWFTNHMSIITQIVPCTDEEYESLICVTEPPPAPIIPVRAVVPISREKLNPKHAQRTMSKSNNSIQNIKNQSPLSNASHINTKKNISNTPMVTPIISSSIKEEKEVDVTVKQKETSIRKSLKKTRRKPRVIQSEFIHERGEEENQQEEEKKEGSENVETNVLNNVQSKIIQRSSTKTTDLLNWNELESWAKIPLQHSIIDTSTQKKEDNSLQDVSISTPSDIKVEDHHINSMDCDPFAHISVENA